MNLAAPAVSGLLLCNVAASMPQAHTPKLRFATFNVSLSRNKAGGLIAELASGGSKQIRAVAEILQRVRPDIVLLNEFDFDAEGRAIKLFTERFLAVGQNGAQPLRYAHVFVAPTNTGVDSGFDLDGDGAVGRPGDAWGFGRFPGQYGMALLSRIPIDRKQTRTFQKLMWRDMPWLRLRDSKGPARASEWYASAAHSRMRLSSKSHWDVVIQHGADRIHVLCAHPTPPVFDGPEDRNGLRNRDEIRFWADYTLPWRSRWIVDDQGRRGGLALEEAFVVLGDYNADPFDGDSTGQAASWLLKHPRIRVHPAPSSAGAAEASQLQAGINARHKSPARFDTADFSDSMPKGPGNLRIDYALPSIHFSVERALVFWPSRSHTLYRLVGDGQRIVSSDHRLVAIDVVPRSTSGLSWKRWGSWWRWLRADAKN